MRLLILIISFLLNFYKKLAKNKIGIIIDFLYKSVK